ncbi:hypothetical protein ACNOYE_10290 [Nannocystaceae bacterium ST9]
MNRRLLRTLPILALSLALSFVGACKHKSTPEGEQPEAKSGRTGAKAKKKIVLPEPLPLPADPQLATWLARPKTVVDRVQPYVPVELDVREAATALLSNVTQAAIAEQFAAAIDTDSPFANVVLDDGEEIVRITPMKGHRDALAKLLAGLEPVGEFGAVALPASASAPSGKPWLAWLDPDDETLVLANSERGLVTGRGMPEAYGASPVFFTLDAASLQANLQIPVELPFARVQGSGNLDALHVDLELSANAEGDPLAELPITQGTLGGLLAGSNLALGASSRYSEHESTVKEIIREVNGQVDQLPFLVRGIGEDLAKKLNTVLRSWDGRVLAAIGPVGHVRVAYGSEDPEKARVAMIRLLQSVVDNIKFARNFISEVPQVTLRRGVGKGDGKDIDMLVLHDAAGVVPAELRALIDGSGKLNVAMAWSERVGGGVVIVGPKAADELGRWLDDTKAEPSGADTQQELVAAMIAAHPDSVRTLAQQAQPDLGAVLGIEPTGSPRWSVSIDKQDQHYLVDLVDLAKSGEANAKPPRAR